MLNAGPLWGEGITGTIGRHKKIPKAIKSIQYIKENNQTKKVDFFKKTPFCSHRESSLDPLKNNSSHFRTLE